MKIKYYLFIAIVTYLGFVLAQIPAQPVSKLVSENAPVRFSAVTGTLWNGHARAIKASGVRLQNVHWEFAFSYLLLGKLAINIDTLYEQQPVTGTVGASLTGKLFAEDLIATLDAGTVSKLAQIPMAQLSGSIEANLDSASWAEGDIPSASGTILWKDAVVTVAESASLGNVTLTLNDLDIQQATISNQGGDISLDGDATLDSEAEYNLKLRMTPSSSASNNIRQSIGLFAAPQNDGSFLLNNSGSLKDLGLL